jgi:NADH-quinone oxidoreductase subunit N
VQTNLKRTLAYSSIAHSGYLMTGLVAGPHVSRVIEGSEVLGSGAGNGLAAVLFYLLVYAMGTVGSFAVLACVRAKTTGDAEPPVESPRGEPDTVTYDDLAGLWWRNPVLAGVMLVAMLSLVGMPPLAGFLGKVYLIGGVFTAGYGLLAIVIVINSAISAGYYLRIAMTCFFGQPSERVGYVKTPTLLAGAIITTLAAFAFGGLAANGIIENSHQHMNARAELVPLVVPTDEAGLPVVPVQARAAPDVID